LVRQRIQRAPDSFRRRLQSQWPDCGPLKRSLPFGTCLVVQDPKTGKSVCVTVNDRGPFTTGMALDISWGAARANALLPGRRNATLLAAPLSYREQDPIDAVAKLAACGLSKPWWLGSTEISPPSGRPYLDHFKGGPIMKAEDSGILLSLVAICCFAASSQQLPSLMAKSSSARTIIGSTAGLTDSKAMP
jgi:hypothetical protein